MAATEHSKTQVVVALEYALYAAASKHAYAEKSSFSQVVQEALEAYLKDKKS